MEFQKRVVTYELVDLDPADLVGISAAAKTLGMSMAGVRSAINRGNLTEIIDPDALSHRGRRFVLRSEIMKLAARRARWREKWGEGREVGEE